MRSSKITTLSECAVMVALAFALSYAKLFEMPLGGSVTVASMLPIMLISIKYGNAIGIGTAFVYSLTQLMQAFLSGNVFPYCQTEGALIACILFDYLVPFTLLGLCGVFKHLRLFKNNEISAYVGMTSVVVLRFLSHFITGVVIWGQWAPTEWANTSIPSYITARSLGVDFAICLAAAILMLRKQEIRKLINLDA